MKQLLLVLSVVVATTASAQKVSNKINFQKGQKLEAVTKVENVISMEMMGQTMDTRVDMTVTRLMDVEDVSGETATIEHKVKRMQMNITDPMGNAKSMDSEKEADMKEEGGKEIEKALKNKYTLKVNNLGIITDVKADDNNPNKDNENAAEEMGAGVLGTMSNGLGTIPKVGSASEFVILPAKAVGKGDSWTDTVKGVTTVYTIADVTPTDIEVKFTAEGKTERTQEANGMEMTIATKDRVTGKIIIDAKSGLMRERKSTTLSTGTIDMAGQTMPMKVRSDMTITMKPM